MKVVQFSNGKYAIQKTIWFIFWTEKRYMDLIDEGMWWNIQDSHFRDCLTDNLDLIRLIMKKPKIIKL